MLTGSLSVPGDYDRVRQRAVQAGCGEGRSLGVGVSGGRGLVALPLGGSIGLSRARLSISSGKDGELFPVGSFSPPQTRYFYFLAPLLSTSVFSSIK